MPSAVGAFLPGQGLDASVVGRHHSLRCTHGGCCPLQWEPVDMADVQVAPLS